MARVARLLIWIIGAVAPAIALGALGGQLGAVIGAGLGLILVVYAWLVLPRIAHGAFEAGKYARASRRYRTLELIAPSAYRQRSARLSRAGCAIAAGDHTAATALLERLDAAALDTSERAVWLNNRACAALAAGGDAHAALALVDEASALRPDVPALQHTRGMALLAVGRIDDAISVLDGMRSAGELPPRLEAERCRDLAKAWAAKGESAYADDYRLRAETLAR